jgi:hypothetical protein
LDLSGWDITGPIEGLRLSLLGHRQVVVSRFDVAAIPNGVKLSLAFAAPTQLPRNFKASSLALSSAFPDDLHSRSPD